MAVVTINSYSWMMGLKSTNCTRFCGNCKSELSFSFRMPSGFIDFSSAIGLCASFLLFVHRAKRDRVALKIQYYFCFQFFRPIDLLSVEMFLSSCRILIYRQVWFAFWLRLRPWLLDFMLVLLYTVLYQ
jgi:hypothetical protein